MLSFFSFASQDSDNPLIYHLTIGGVILILMLILILIGCAVFFKPKGNASGNVVKQLVFSSIAMALSIVTSYLKIVSLPFGGSITFFSMLFLVLIGYWYGPKAGLMIGFSYGLLQFILEPVFYSIPQLLVDYPLAFGALGLSGFFSRKKHGLWWGYLTGVLGRYAFAVLSGVIFFGYYTPEGTPALFYSLGYNAAYIFPEAVLTLFILSLPPVSSAMSLVKRMAAESDML